MEIRSLPNQNKPVFPFLVSFGIFLWIRVNSLKPPVDLANQYHIIISEKMRKYLLSVRMQVKVELIYSQKSLLVPIKVSRGTFSDYIKLLKKFHTGLTENGTNELK